MSKTELIIPNEKKELIAANDESFGEKSPSQREGKIRIGLVDASSLMENRARDIATDRLSTEKGELHGISGTLKKIWKYNLAAEYYRQKEIALVREQIAKSGTTFIDRNDADQQKSAHTAAMGAIAKRFVTDGEEMMHEGESRTMNANGENVESNESHTALKDLVLRYGRGDIEDETTFQTEKQKIIDRFKGDDASVKFADNLFAVAQQVRQAIDHGESSEALENDLEVIEGNARSGVRTEANLSACDRLIEKLHSTRLGALVNETTLALAVGTVWSVGVFAGTRLTSSKLAALASFGGTAALGAGVAAARESIHMKQDRSAHARDRAQGKEIDPDNNKRRQEMEGSVYAMRSANEMTRELSAALFETDAEGNVFVRKDLDGTSIQKALQSLAEVETRVRMSDSRRVDLVSYSSAEKVEQERFDLDMARSQTKVEIRKFLTSHPEIVQNADGKAVSPEDYMNTLLAEHSQKTELALGQEMSHRDKIFNTMRRKNMRKSALFALGTGLLVGSAVQEGVAFAKDDQQGLIEGLVNGDDKQSSSQTLLRYLAEKSHLTGASLPETTLQSRNVSVSEWLQHQEGVSKVHRLGWHDNDTVKFDKNELQLRWGGEHGTGIDKDGRFVFDVKHMIKGGSHHGGLSADALELAKEGKLKMILSPSEATGNQVLEIPIDAKGQVAFDPQDDKWKELFTVKDGKAVFSGKYAEVAEVVKAASKDHPVEDIRVLATHIGKDSLDTLTVTETIPVPVSAELIPEVPLMPIHGRTPLEKMKKNDEEKPNKKLTLKKNKKAEDTGAVTGEESIVSPIKEASAAVNMKKENLREKQEIDPTIRIKAKAIVLEWERQKKTLAFRHGIAHKYGVNEMLQGMFETVVRKSQYSDEQINDLASALQKEGVKMKRRLNRKGVQQWQMNIENKGVK